MHPFLVAYVPVLHKGYISFFRKYTGAVLFIIGSDMLRGFEHLHRDIRGVCPEDMRTVILSLGIFTEVRILTRESVVDIYDTPHSIVMPDEDVSRAIAGQYFFSRHIIFESIFLRWDVQNTTSEQAIQNDRTVSRDEFDREIMSRAFSEATKSPDWWRQIGVLVVRDGAIILSGFNSHMPHQQSLYAFGDPRGNFSWGERIELSNAQHAERAVIARAARLGVRIGGAFLYVTTFPCPPCAMDVVEAGIKRLYYCEGYSLVGAAEILRAHNVELIRVET